MNISPSMICLLTNTNSSRVIRKKTWKSLSTGTGLKLGKTKESQMKQYDPPLPKSVQKEEGCYGEKVPNSEAKYGH